MTAHRRHVVIAAPPRATGTFVPDRGCLIVPPTAARGFVDSFPSGMVPHLRLMRRTGSGGLRQPESKRANSINCDRSAM